MKKIPVGILGATGVVGQHYLKLLENHPWFEVAFLASSDQSAGKSFSEAISERRHFSSNDFDSMRIHSLHAFEEAKKSCHFVFSALANEGAKKYEELYAAQGFPVISNAGVHRHVPDIPILIPEVNPEHAKLIHQQRKNRGWTTGFIAVKPNCSIQSYMIPLTPLHKEYGVSRLHVTTLQALSGSGYPGVASLDIVDNVIPHIANEEEKSEIEPLKIWGEVTDRGILPAKNMKISAHCNRVPVIDGHLACVSVSFEKKPSHEAILRAWSQIPSLKLPSAPSETVIYRREPDRPQPRKDRDAGNGMAVTVGRLRECPLFDYRFVGLSHNTVRGAAGGGILNAEFLFKEGYIC